MPLTSTQVFARLIEDSVIDMRQPMPRTLRAMSDAGRIRVTKNIKPWDVVMPTAEESLIQGIDTAGTLSGGSDTIQAELGGLGEYKVHERFTIKRSDIVRASELAPDFLKDLYQETLRDRLQKLARKINKLIWTGDGSVGMGKFIGIPKVMDNTYNYAGIDRTLWTKWKSPQLDNATARPLTRELMLKFDTLVYTEMLNYDMVVAHPLLLESYSKVFDTIAGAGQLATSTEGAENYRRVELGYGQRSFNGLPILGEPDAPADSIFTMNSSDIILHFFDLAVDPKADGSVGGQDRDEYGVIGTADFYGIPVNVSRILTNIPNIIEFEMSVHPIMQVRNPRGLSGIRKLT